MSRETKPLSKTGFLTLLKRFVEESSDYHEQDDTSYLNGPRYIDADKFLALIQEEWDRMMIGVDVIK